MAKIVSAQNERVFQIKQWLGLHESADGDTKLKMGEAAVMRNFRVTRDGNLQKRPGAVPAFTPLSSGWGDCRGTICTTMNALERVFAVFGENLYSCWDNNSWTLTRIGTVTGDDYVNMFVYADNLYIIADGKYWVSDGATISYVTPYVPLVVVSIPPAGGGSTVEQVNKLTKKRRVWLSPDGNEATFQLPEKDLGDAAITAVLTSDFETAVTISSSDKANGTVTFSAAPVAGTNTIEVRYEVKTDDSYNVLRQHQMEFYNGDQNNRVFLYGVGNKSYYSGINYDGQPDPTYFPDLNEIVVGDDVTAIRAMVRYNSRLLCFKEHSTYTIQYGQYTLEDGSLIAAFYVTPVHKSIGCSTSGQVQMVENTPVALYETDIYSWSGNKYGSLTADERQCKIISDRVYATLRGMSPYNCHCYDDNYHKEYYICDEETQTALVWNYAVDAWSVYTGLRIRFPFVFHGKMYFADRIYDSVKDEWNGTLQYFDDDSYYDEIDEKASIPCYWESGSISFGADYQRKYSAMLWVGLHPQTRSEVYVTVKTDRTSSLTEKLIGYGFIGFGNINFNRFTFNTVHRPILKRLKIKAKKFVYYKLIFNTDTDYSTVTITTSDIRVRFTGYAK